MAKILPSQIKHSQRFIKESPYPGVQNEKGWMLATIAMMIPLAIIALAFVIDLGNTYRIKEKIKYASDAALVAVGRVYPERPEIHDNKEEVKRLLKKMFLFNLISNGMDVGPDSFVGTPEYYFTENSDGSYNIGINASYIVDTFYSDVFGLFPGGGEFAQLQGTTTSSTYRIGKKKLIVGILIDLSNSVGPSRYNALLDGVIEVLKNVPEGDYIAVSTFDIFGMLDTSKVIRFAQMRNFYRWEFIDKMEKYRELNIHRPDGTYLQGALFGMKNEMLAYMERINTDAFPENDENWGDFRKVIFVLSDGAFTKRSQASPDLSIYGKPYDLTHDYDVSFSPMKTCGGINNTNPLTMFEADQIRKAGILVSAICSENCLQNNNSGKINRASMKRLANAPLDPIDMEESNFRWQLNTSSICYVPYLTSGSERFKDPNSYVLPAELGASDLYTAVGDSETAIKIQVIMNKITRDIRFTR